MRYTKAIFFSDQIKRRPNATLSTLCTQGIGARRRCVSRPEPCSADHDLACGTPDHRYQGRHRSVTTHRPDLRHALYRLALREWPEGQEIRLFSRSRSTVRVSHW